MKALALGVLSCMPGGPKTYHALQVLLRTNKPQPDEYLSRALEVPDMIRAQGGSPQDASFLEIGTGWRPFLPFLLSLLGASRVLTLDVNPWLDRNYALQTHEALGARLGVIAGRLGVDLDDLRRRFQAADRHTADLGGLLDAY